MEQVENPMVMPEYEYKSDYIPDDVWAEREDRDYQDKIFEEMIEEER
nr:MAG TPA: hypothetical protein [Caudoviricetes sp.]